MILDTLSETWYLEKHCLTAAKRLESTCLCSVGASRPSGWMGEVVYSSL